MKLVFLIDSPRKIGGGDYAQFIFARELALQGHDVTIFARDKNFFSPQLKGVPRLSVKYYHSLPLFAKRMGIGLLNQTWSWLYSLTVTKRYLQKHHPDWIIGYLRHSAIKAVRLGKATGVAVANFIFETPTWMEQELPSEWFEELKNNKFRKSWERTKSAYAASDVLLPNSQRSAQMCKQWLPQAVVSEPVYPGIDLSTIKKSKKKDRPFDIVYLGRLNVLKNVNELLLAAAGLKHKPKILLIGSGEEEFALQAIAQDKVLDVTFAGAVSDEEKWKLLQQSKVLVFPTSHEGFGMPPLEAIACGCQVICSHLPIFDEVYGNAIHYFPLHNVRALTAVLEDVLAGKKMMPVSAKKLTEKYTWSAAVQTIEHVLKKYTRKGENA